MITVEKAGREHVKGIIDVCTKGYWFTYQETHSAEYIRRVVNEFYNEERVMREVTETTRDWGGYFVALDGGNVVGACGGGMTGETIGEIFVLYIDPQRRNEGIGSALLHALTQQQHEYGAIEQWVSVQKGNIKGIPFYQRRGFKEKGIQQGYANKEEESYLSIRFARPLV
ncbi:GNAT family N-acetyltransferase [Halobacillus sp. BBL2006]|uniref:GNAT family N-acetyltransferase n=1 Tax=Halobacillus sp. BBL2006 TaxID=1543706 RepID=UPI000541B052|nr:GNAT family N-acetyltransferase [Halobacillus sp. BBL2006]KHE72372.1 acetyltransferase [Halobacillus sp. BBL2006]